MCRAALHIDGLACDLDGVVYRGKEAIPGSAEAIAALKTRGIRVVFATNNAMRTVGQFLDRLAGMGIEAEAGDLVSSAVVTVEELERRGLATAAVLVVGGDGIQESLEQAGAIILEPSRGHEAEVVVVASTPDFTFEQMKAAATAVRGGATFVATNADPTYPTEEGLWPGAGAILAGIEVASGRKAEVMGKPNRPMMDAIGRRFAGLSAIAAVGDQPRTDLAGAREMGWKTILVLSGVVDEGSVAALTPAPDLVLRSLAELPPLVTGPG